MNELANFVSKCHADDLFALATDDKRGEWEEMQARSHSGYADSGCVWYEKENPQDGNTFAVFPVDALRANGVKVREHIYDQKLATDPGHPKQQSVRV